MRFNSLNNLMAPSGIFWTPDSHRANVRGETSTCRAALANDKPRDLRRDLSSLPSIGKFFHKSAHEKLDKNQVSYPAPPPPFGPVFPRRPHNNHEAIEASRFFVSADGSNENRDVGLCPIRPAIKTHIDCVLPAHPGLGHPCSRGVILGFFLSHGPHDEVPSLTPLFSNMIERIFNPPLIKVAASISNRFVEIICMASFATAAARCASLFPLRSISNSSNNASQSPLDVRIVDFITGVFLNIAFLSELPRRDATAQLIDYAILSQKATGQ